MNKIEKIEKMLVDHFDTTCEAAYTDRDLLVKVKEMITEYKEDAKTKAAEDVAEQAKPSNIYQVKMAKMTPQEMTSMGVQLISVNNSELFWVTSVGQLYGFNNKQAALEAEYTWLMSKPN